jgi:Polysaccharide pyruvyl transferase
MAATRMGQHNNSQQQHNKQYSSKAVKPAALLRPRVLALGFYDRRNFGDDCYKHIIGTILGTIADVTLLCVDDASCDLIAVATFDFIFIGGGDVVNPYFMSKVVTLLGARSGTCPCYALSVGIAYPDDAGYLDYFDHVFVRSAECYEIAVRQVGPANVSLLPDLVYALPLKRALPPPDSGAQLSGVIPGKSYHLGLCLAQPVFAAAGPPLVQAFADLMVKLYKAMKETINVIFHLIPFNSGANPAECDCLLNANLQAAILASQPNNNAIPVCNIIVEDGATLACCCSGHIGSTGGGTIDPSYRCNDDAEEGPTAAMRHILSRMDGLMCMRFHSVVLALLESKPFFVVHTTSKVRKAVADLQLVSGLALEDFVYEMPKDAADVPVAAEFASHTSCLANRMASFYKRMRISNAARCPQFVMADFDEISAVVQTRKRRVPFAASQPGVVNSINKGLSRSRNLSQRRRSCCVTGDDDSLAVTLFDQDQIRLTKIMQRLLSLSSSLLSSSPSSSLKQANNGSLHEDIARAVCYVATGDVTSRYIWGLKEKLSNGSVPMDMASLKAECRFIRDDHQHTTTTKRSMSLMSPLNSNNNNRKRARYIAGPLASYATTSKSLGASQLSSQQDEWAHVCEALPPVLEVTVDLDYVGQQHDLASYHRSGWAYALYGLRALEQRVAVRRAPLILDTYLDRTFHWGRRVLEADGVIPYTQPWAGFVHHTFDEEYSTYNCHRLLDDSCFLASLSTCKGLIVMTSSLREQLVAALAKRGFPSIPVHAVPHPTEFPAVPASPSKPHQYALKNNTNANNTNSDNIDTFMFSMPKFLSRNPRKLAHVGAWLRHPYEFYSLRVPVAMDGTATQKHLVMGADMATCLPPCNDMLDRIAQSCLASSESMNNSNNNYHNTEQQHSGQDGMLMCRNGHDSIDDQRNNNDDNSNNDNPCNNSSFKKDACSGKYTVPTNKFFEGLLNNVKEQLESVHVVQRLSNEEYDALLSDSIVFLHLADAAAVNTVVECIVRNTPLLVNRLPGLEEMLGKGYPGFYRDLVEAGAMAANVTQLATIHRYLVAMDKTRFRLPYFVRSVYDFLCACEYDPEALA